MPRLASLARYFEFYPDPTCSQSLAEVRTHWDEQAFFRYFQGPEFNTDTCYWARLTLYNPKPFPQIRTFAYWDYKWENIEYYLPDQLGNYTRFQAKPVESNQEAFTFSVPAKDTLTLYIRYPLSYQMQSANGSIVDIPKEDLDRQAELGYFKFFLAGGMFLFLIYFFFQLIVGRQRIVFHYFFMLIGFYPFLLICLDLTYLFVFTKTLIAHQSVFTMSWVIILASLLAMIGFLNFTQVSLNLKLYFPKYVTLINVLIAVELCFAILGAILLFYWFKFEKANDTFIIVHKQIQSISGLYHALATLLIICIALHAFIQKVPLSGSFLLATLPIGLATIYTSIAQVFSFTFDLSFLPFLENAIWHGLLHKDGERELKLTVQGEEDSIVCIIEDNGIGREQAKILQLNTQKQHRSFGTQLTQDRLQVNNRLFNSQYLVNIIDKMIQGKAAGTRVELHLSTS